SENGPQANHEERGEQSPILYRTEKVLIELALRLSAALILPGLAGQRRVETQQDPRIGVVTVHSIARELLPKANCRDAQLFPGVFAQSPEDHGHLFAPQFFLLLRRGIGPTMCAPQKLLRVVRHILQLIADRQRRVTAMLLQVPSAGAIGKHASQKVRRAIPVEG